MGLVATDIVVKSTIEAALAHLRQNEWLWDDIWGELATDPLSRVEYGWKEVDAAKRWFKANNVLTVFPFRQDGPTLPCFTVLVTSTGEDTEVATLGDEGEEFDDFDPKQNALQPQRVYAPFTPKKYDMSTGTITFPDSLTTNFVVPGQFMVSQKSGKAYQIYKIAGNGFQIKAGTRDDFTDGYIVPPTSLWNEKKERTKIAENVVIGVHAQSDPVQCMWMRMLIMYILLRYKEAYFESRGFDLTTFTCGEIDLNPNFQNSDRVYSCFVTLTGKIETRWIKYVAPKLQSTQVDIRIADGPKTPEAYLKQVQAQGWSMPPDPPAPPADNAPFPNDADPLIDTIEDGIESPSEEDDGDEQDHQGDPQE